MIGNSHGLPGVCIKESMLTPGSNGEASRSEKLFQETGRFYRFNEKVLGMDVEVVESVEKDAKYLL